MTMDAPTFLPFFLVFRDAAVEGEYLTDVAKNRFAVLVMIFGFDILCYTIRLVAKVLSTAGPGGMLVAGIDVLNEMGPQLANMVGLYTLVGFMNRKSRKHGDKAARKEEILLLVLMTFAISNLVASLGGGSPQDYVYAAFILICTTTFLMIRWWIGTAALTVPLCLLYYWKNDFTHHLNLPQDAMTHMLVAWLAGGLMSYLAEWYRRQMFSSRRQAAAAHQKELLEAQGRVRAQRQLAAAQAQAAQRALVVAREKAAHEAQIEFMSLMCHEVRTPLNGCLASAEMLLETNLCSEQRELANTIRVSGSILLSTVSNFLDFFKIEAGKTLDIVRAQVDLLQLVHDIHCIIEAMVGRSGEVQLLHPELVLPHHAVICDPDRVRGILLNLYTNAAKFTKSGHIGLRVQEVSGQYQPQSRDGYSSVTVTPAYQHVAGRTSTATASSGSSATSASQAVVCSSNVSGVASCQSTLMAAVAAPGAGDGQVVAADVSSGTGAVDSPCQQQHTQQYQQVTEAEGPDSGWLLFEVMDTGVGITPDGLRTLFKEYCQGTEDDMRKPRSKGGTGLGLSICSKQVAVLGGRIGAYSCPGKGSVFWFTIPLILPELLPDGPVVDGAATATGNARPASSPGVPLSSQCHMDDVFAMPVQCAFPAPTPQATVLAQSSLLEPVIPGQQQIVPDQKDLPPARENLEDEQQQGHEVEKGHVVGVQDQAQVAVQDTDGTQPDGETQSEASLPCAQLMSLISKQSPAWRGACVGEVQRRESSLSDPSASLALEEAAAAAAVEVPTGSEDKPEEAGNASALVLPPATFAGHERSTLDLSMFHERQSCTRARNPSPLGRTPAQSASQVPLQHPPTFHTAQHQTVLSAFAAGPEQPVMPSHPLPVPSSLFSRPPPRVHPSIDMPPHFTMDTDQPSVAALLHRRLNHLAQTTLQNPPMSTHASPRSSSEWPSGQLGASGFHVSNSHMNLNASAGGSCQSNMSMPPSLGAVTASDAGQTALSTAQHASMEAVMHANRSSNSPSLRHAPSQSLSRVSSHQSLASQVLGSGSLAGYPQGATVTPVLSLSSSPIPHLSNSNPNMQHLNFSHLPLNLVGSHAGLLSSGGIVDGEGVGKVLAGMTHPSPPQPPANPAAAMLRGRRVLLVEDNLINQTVARKMLAGLGMQCTVASNGQEAVHTVEKALQQSAGKEPGRPACGYDVILMDMMMPVMGGVDATKAIRVLEASCSSATAPGSSTSGSDAHGSKPAPCQQLQQQQKASSSSSTTTSVTSAQQSGSGVGPSSLSSSSPSSEPAASGAPVLPPSRPGTPSPPMMPCVPILAMTANASDKDREECRAAGMNGFLSKPVLKDRLADAIAQVLTGVAWRTEPSK